MEVLLSEIHGYEQAALITYSTTARRSKRAFPKSQKRKKKKGGGGEVGGSRGMISPQQTKVLQPSIRRSSYGERNKNKK